MKTLGKILMVCVSMSAFASAHAGEINKDYRYFYVVRKFWNRFDCTANNYRGDTGINPLCLPPGTLSIITDLVLLPFQAIPLYGETTTDVAEAMGSDVTTAKAQSTSQGFSDSITGLTSENDRQDQHKREVNDYKKSLVYAVADDAVYFTASADHEPSTALARALELLRPHFAGHDDRQIAALLVKAHMEGLEAMIGLE